MENPPVKSYLALAALPILAACAQTPNSITPVSLGNAFAGIDCATASNALVAEQQSLAALSSKQKGAVVGDAVGVLMLGVPVSSLVGADHEGEIAASKGKILAYEARLTTCH
jgi:hypothetical protein